MLIAEFLPFLLMNYVPVYEKDDVPAKIRKEIRIRHINKEKLTPLATIKASLLSPLGIVLAINPWI